MSRPARAVREDASRPNVAAAADPGLAGVVACFVLSGFAALLYQTAWLRQFSLVFGTSELAVATVLAAYMAGLALGAAIAARFVSRVVRPVRAYALLEAGIALSALAVPWLLRGAGALYAAVLGGQPELPDASEWGQPVFYLVIGFGVLALPTTFMGATLPLLVRHAIQSDRALGPRISLLYATNTAGAVLGAALTGFVLLPNLGLGRTIWVGIATNVLVFAIASRLPSAAAPRDPTEDDGEGEASTRGFAWILPVMLLSGTVSFVYEVLWTRLLSPLLGGSITAFATLLAAFLTGIAIGGSLAGAAARSRATAGRAFVAAQVGAGLASIAIYAWMGELLPASRAPGTLALYAFAVLVPAALFIGATFPLAVRILAESAAAAGTATARVYSWNTVGSILGATAAGFFLIPTLGFAGAIRLAVCTNFALALATAFSLVNARKPVLLALAGLLVATALGYAPERPRLATAEPLQRTFVDPTELFYEVGRSATVLMVESGDDRWLFTNGLTEARIPPRGAVARARTVPWLTALPALARPEATTFLVIGLGGGIALEGVPTSAREIDVVELEPAVVAANRTLSGNRSYDPLGDPRVRVVLNDARNALRLSDKRYDVIVSQPSHPWTAGASHLYTREFLELTRSRLADDGVFLQWMGSAFVTEDLLRSLAATLTATFAQVELYSPGSGALLLLGSDAPIEPERALAAGRPEAGHFAAFGLGTPEDLRSALLLDDAQLRAFAADAPTSTDDHNRMATHSRPAGDGLSTEDVDRLFVTPSTRETGAEAPDHAYWTRRSVERNRPAHAAALAASAPAAVRPLVEAERHEASGDLDAAREALRGAPTGDLHARYLRYRLEPDPIARGELEAAPGALGAVARAWRATDERSWATLAGLDGALAGAPAQAPWCAEAVRLRALWRTKLAVERERHARVAIALLDTALATAPERDVFALLLTRVEAALAVDDADLIVESSRAAIEFLAGGEVVAGGVPPATLDAIAAAVDSVAVRDDTPERLAARARRVAQRARRLSARAASKAP